MIENWKKAEKEHWINTEIVSTQEVTITLRAWETKGLVKGFRI